MLKKEAPLKPPAGRRNTILALSRSGRSISLFFPSVTIKKSPAHDDSMDASNTKARRGMFPTTSPLTDLLPRLLAND
jgi:hypothetical protein